MPVCCCKKTVKHLISTLNDLIEVLLMKNGFPDDARTIVFSVRERLKKHVATINELLSIVKQANERLSTDLLTNRIKLIEGSDILNRVNADIEDIMTKYQSKVKVVCWLRLK